MRKKIILLSSLIIIVLILVGVYFTIDKKLYFYGRNTFNIYNELPFDFKTDYWDWNRERFDGKSTGFVLMDNYEFVLLSRRYDIGNAFITSRKDRIKTKVNKILSYGYNKDKLLAIIEDTVSNKYLLEYEKNPDSLSKIDIEIDVYNIKELDNIDKKKYNWIELERKKDEIQSLIRYKSIIELLIFVIIVVFSFHIYKLIFKK